MYILRQDVKYSSHYEKEIRNLRVTVRRVTTIVMASYYISFKNLLTSCTRHYPHHVTGVNIIFTRPSSSTCIRFLPSGLLMKL
jgi:hypothetical protein